MMPARYTLELILARSILLNRIQTTIPYLDPICHTRKDKLDFGVPEPSFEAFEEAFESV